MYSTGPGCCEAAAQFARVFSIGAGHERGRLFVANLYKTYFVLARSERLHDAVYAVPRQTKNSIDSPFCDRFYQNIGCCMRHFIYLPVSFCPSFLSSVCMRKCIHGKTNPSAIEYTICPPNNTIPVPSTVI